MRPVRVARAVVLLASLAACRLEPTGATAWDPPPEYRSWFASTEACSGLTGDFDRIDWYVVPGRSFDCPGGQCAGHWASNHAIYIAEEWVGHEMVVRHEMLHDLLGRSGHPDPPFGSPCPLTWETWSETDPAAPAVRRLALD